MTRHIVCLTFDHDNMSPFISRGMTTPTPISRGDFGIVATARLLALFARYRIKTTWFTPGHTIETYPDCARAVFAAGHEIAHHGWTHVVPATLSRARPRQRRDQDADRPQRARLSLAVVGHHAAYRGAAAQARLRL
jgi:peptidoglycan-N-acetylglucosamine deacetylase